MFFGLWICKNASSSARQTEMPSVHAITHTRGSRMEKLATKLGKCSGLECW